MSSFPPPPTNLIAAWERAAKHFPQRGILFCDRRGRLAPRVRYPELLEGILRSAGRFLALETRPGDRVMICLPSGPEFIECWFGALFAGALPVALAPPQSLGSSQAVVDRLEGTYEKLGARWLLCRPSLKAVLESEGRRVDRVALSVDGWDAVEARRPDRWPHPDPEETAFLQMTSGSTGSERAVMIPHRAVVANTLGSGEAIGRPHGAPAWEWARSLVSWLPLHHDMGLVGGIIFSLVNGLDLLLASPQAFLTRPRVWLDLLSEAGPSISPAPNFGYQLCLERLTDADLEGVDLSSWRTALFGAEMVRPETVGDFSARFEHLGFDPLAARPCYGMAETTLAISFDCAGKGLRTLPAPAAVADAGFEDVPCNGVPIPGTRIRVAAPDGSELPEGRVGHVLVSGSSLFQGYFRDEEATRECLRNGWLWTGDLGFMSDGEIYLTGRTKDILIIRGQNVMPHDLEWIAEGVSGAGGSLRVGAFSVPHRSEGEQAVLVVEVHRDSGDALVSLDQEIRARIGRRMALVLADLVFVRRGRIPKTSSGKVRRRELRARYLDNKLGRVG